MRRLGTGRGSGGASERCVFVYLEVNIHQGHTDVFVRADECTAPND